MFIEVSKIPPEGMDVSLPAETVELGESTGLWEGPATVRAEMHLSRSGRGLVIDGSFSGAVPLVCSRCLEPFSFQAEDRFNLYCEVGLRPVPGEEHELGKDDLDVTYLEEGRVNTDHLLRENLLLSLPVQPLCREDCRGLCPQCGANVNQTACGCRPGPTDPRLQVLRKLR